MDIIAAVIAAITIPANHLGNNSNANAGITLSGSARLPKYANPASPTITAPHKLTNAHVTPIAVLSLNFFLSLIAMYLVKMWG